MSELRELYAAHIATLIDRTSAALERTGYERAVIHAGDTQLRSRFDDVEHPFRPVPAFAHFVPWPWPGSALVLEKGRAARLLARRRTDFWERLPRPDVETILHGLDVEEVADLSSLYDVARKPGSAFIGETVAAGVKLGFDERAVNPHPLVEELHETRVTKTPYEVECLLMANQRAVRGHRAIREAFLAGERSELALHLAYLSATEQDEPDTPYKNIVALGGAGAVLHHHVYERRPDARSLLVDAGATVRGYCADITRTYLAADAIEGIRALHAGLEKVQQAVCGWVEVGKGFEALHDEAHNLIGSLVVDLGLVTCSAEAAVAEGLTRVFFPHGLGHSLGIQVHDVACRRTPPRKENAWLRNTRTIEPGQVFTIEPGFYFIDALLDPLKASPAGESVAWDRIDPLRPFGGIRIEDDVLVLQPGSRSPGSGSPIRNLTREAFAYA